MIIDDKYKNKVEMLYKNNTNISDISKQLSISERTISRYLISINTPCDYCGKIYKNRCFKGMRIFCNRHYFQMKNHGKCFKSIFDQNEYLKCEGYYKMYFDDKDLYALISDCSYEQVKQYKWHIRPDGYVETKINNQSVLLHRFVINFKYETVDHINRNKLDNRIENLREVSVSQNQINKSIQKNNTSGVVGVSWDKSRNLWHVMITVDKKHINLGRYLTLEEAELVRLEAERKYHKEYTPIERRQYV